MYAPPGNTFIDIMEKHIAQFVKNNLPVEFALNPSDESLRVSRKKVNGHTYHMLKDGQAKPPEPVSVTGEHCT